MREERRVSEIKWIKVRENEQGRVRIYAQTSDVRDGQYWLTADDYHEAGYSRGRITDAEWQQVLKIATRDSEIHSVRQEDMDDAKVRAGIAVTKVEVEERSDNEEVQPRTNAYAGRCIWCGRSVAARAGELLYLDPEDARDDIKYGNARYAGSGWQVQCAGGCQPVFGSKVTRRVADSRAPIQDQSSEQEGVSGNSLDDTWNFYGLQNEGEDE